MTDAHHHDHAADHGAGHDDHGGHAKYWYVFFALCVLTGASFFTYSDYWPFHGTPAVGWTFMMAVSSVKASLVILFFMHLKYEADWKYVLTIPASIMSIFLMFALVPDIGMRVRRYSEERFKEVGTRDDALAIEAASSVLHPADGAHGGH